MKEQKDPINPNYYDDVYTILIKHKFTEEQIITICEFNAYKYLYRWRDKNGIEDLKKAIWYLTDIIRYKEKQNGHNSESWD